MATSPIYVASVQNGQVQISTANANRDGTGTIGTLITAGGTGLQIQRISIKATGTTTAGMIRLFLHDGSVYRLWKERAVTAITVSATVPAFEDEIDCSTPSGQLILPSTWSLRVSTEKGETFNVISFGGPF